MKPDTPSDYVLVAVSALLILGVLFASYKNYITSELAAAIGSLGLVFATSLSLVTTRATLKEQRRARRQEAKPALRLDAKPVTLGSYVFLVENIGNGSAQNPQLAIEVIPEEESAEPHISEVSMPDIPAGQSVPVSVGTSTGDSDENSGFIDGVKEIDKEALDATQRVEMHGTCVDLLGDSHQVQSSFDPRYLEKGIAINAEQDVSDELRNIRSEISDIERTISRALR